MQKMHSAAIAFLLLTGCNGGGGGSTNRSPMIGTIPPSTARVAVPYSLTVAAIDPEGGDIAYSLDAGPAGMTIDAATGVVTWTPAEADLGPQAITIRATDSAELFDQIAWIVNVAYDAAPIVSGVGESQACVGQPLATEISAWDPDGDTLTYTSEDAPAGLVLDADLGSIDWTPTGDEAGHHEASFTVADPWGESATFAAGFDVLGYSTDPFQPFVLGGDETVESTIRIATRADGTTLAAFAREVSPQASRLQVLLLGTAGCPSLLWESATISNLFVNEIETAPDGGAVILYTAGNSPSRLEAVRVLANGTTAWTTAATVEAGISVFGGALTLDATGVYVAFTSSAFRVQKLDIATGQRLWGSTGTSVNATASTPVLAPWGDGGILTCFASGAAASCARVAANGTIVTGPAAFSGATIDLLYSASTITPAFSSGVDALAKNAAGRWVVSYRWSTGGFPSTAGTAVASLGTGLTATWASGAIDPNGSFGGIADPLRSNIGVTPDGDFFFSYMASSGIWIDTLAAGNGAEIWPASTRVSTASFFSGIGSVYLSLLVDGGEAVLTFGGSNGARIQRISATGARLWGDEGTTLTSTLPAQNELHLRLGPQGRAIVGSGWLDTSGDRDVLVQSVRANGTLGPP